MMEVKKYKNIDELVQNCPRNSIIGENLIRAWSKVNSPLYDKIICLVSGGEDSDVMLDIMWRCDLDNKVIYAWFDTGLEYQATKDHLKYLEEKYDIQIQRFKAIKPIPNSCKEYGQPFMSKYVSEMIQRLQRHNFKWEDKSFEELYKEYPKCKVALQWWCNCNISNRYDISRNKYLKEFMVANPPQFKISNKCCKYAKKDLVHKIIAENGYDLEVNGVRRAEGGIRDVAYKSCFDSNGDWDRYRPLFWYANKDKAKYIIHYGVVPSDCYLRYGLERTGCAGCPFGKRFEAELEIIERYEPKLHKAVNKIFGDSYAYTRAYKKFCAKMGGKDKYVLTK